MKSFTRFFSKNRRVQRQCLWSVSADTEILSLLTTGQEGAWGNPAKGSPILFQQTEGNPFIGFPSHFHSDVLWQ